MQKSKIKCLFRGGESVQQPLPPFIVFLTLIEAAWAHCFISVNIYRAAVSRVYFQSIERSLKGKRLNCLELFCICENIFTVKSTSYFTIGNVGLTCKGKVKAQTG
uniref:Uncharacterized protein n=1 Tax=Rhinopithecus bieti TaxID=61621 RepID=A0A2K6LQ17_RHIBE